MRILSRVCVDFRDKNGQTIFLITPRDRMVLLDAPDAIQQDPIFALLVSERSLEIVKSKEQQKELEADPVQDADATGKRKSSKSAKGKETAARSSASDAGTDSANPDQSGDSADAPASADAADSSVDPAARPSAPQS